MKKDKKHEKKDKVDGEKMKKKAEKDANIEHAASSSWQKPEDTAAAAASGSASSSAHKPADNADSKKSKDTSKSKQSEDIVKNCTYLFTQLSEFKEQEKAEAPKDVFVKSDLIVPGIALKKAKQAVDTYQADASQFLGVLGAAKVRMYKIERPGVQKQVMGKYHKDIKMFWKEVQKHLHGEPVKLIMVSDNSVLAIKDATSLMSQKLYCIAVYTCCMC